MMGQLLMKLQRKLQADLPNSPLQCYLVSDKVIKKSVQPLFSNEDSYFKFLFPDNTVAAVNSPTSNLTDIAHTHQPTISRTSDKFCPYDIISMKPSHIPVPVSILKQSTISDPPESSSAPPPNDVPTQGQTPTSISKPYYSRFATD